MKKREFLTSIGVLGASVFVLPSIGCIATEKKTPFGIQLYSLRDELTPSGVETVIEKVANAGYQYVEAYGYTVKDGFWGLSPQAFKSLLTKHALTCPSAHYDFSSYQKNGDLEIVKNYIETAKTIGNEYIVIPYITPDVYKDIEVTKDWIAKINTAAKLIKNSGLKLAYHNHDIEFYDLGNGKNAYEMLLNDVSPDLMDFEMDIYWIVRAQKDPLKFFNDYPGRFKLWHIKDINKTNPTRNTEIGNGTIDFPSIIKEAKKAGLKYPFVEQENFEMDIYKSINISSQYLQKNL